MKLSSTVRHMAAIALATVVMSGFALAAEFKPFITADFEAAQKAGKPVIVDVAASWCPTCKAQKPVIDALGKDPSTKDMTIFRMDFDTQKSELASLGGQMQSTLIAFRGTTETGRSVGDTDPQSIAALFATTAK
nr:thioredoxin family protein [uncultured Gellertiella sp.]